MRDEGCDAVVADSSAVALEVVRHLVDDAGGPPAIVRPARRLQRHSLTTVDRDVEHRLLAHGGHDELRRQVMRRSFAFYEAVASGNESADCSLAATAVASGLRIGLDSFSAATEAGVREASEAVVAAPLDAERGLLNGSPRQGRRTRSRGVGSMRRRQYDRTNVFMEIP